jgi:hypothetical protein
MQRYYVRDQVDDIGRVLVLGSIFSLPTQKVFISSRILAQKRFASALSAPRQ